MTKKETRDLVKSALLFFYGVMFLLLASCTAPGRPRPVSYAGSYQGASVHAGPYGQSLVEGLDITERAGRYQLEGFMNATNREEGMDHVSNTRSQWKGTGTMKGDVLAFTITWSDGQRGTGSLRRDSGGFALALENIQYRLQRSPP